MRRYREETKSMTVPAEYENAQMRNRRNGLRMGVLKDVCAQHGAEIRKEGGLLVISAPRRQMQRVLEKVHWARIPYQIPQPPAKRS